MLIPRSAMTLAAAAVAAATACYQNDAPTLPLGQPRVSVLLTDAPFPYDSVASVNIHIVRIEANEHADTSDGGAWVLIAEPDEVFDLLELRQGNTALLGRGELPAGQYRAVRMTIDTSRSSVVWSGGAKAPVNWQNFSGSPLMPLYALVESPVDVPTEGAEIVIDFDVGRSFLYDFVGTKEFTLIPQLRAVNQAATGVISGVVTSDYTGQTRPIENANVTVYSGDPSNPADWWIVATGRSDDQGRYRVAFLRAGTYQVRIEQPQYPFLSPVTRSGVTVTRGATTTVSASLPEAGASGAYIQISGPTSVGVGGYISLQAAVGDTNGDPVFNPTVTWTSSDTTVAAVVGGNDTGTVTVHGRAVGVATISATSGGLTDTHHVEVIRLGPVATVTVVPESATVMAGDSGILLSAVLRDADGNDLNLGAAWATADTAVLRVVPCGSCSQARVWGHAAGVGTVTVTRDGKTGRATITVRAPTPVATVTVAPGSADLEVGAYVGFQAHLRDATGASICCRSIAWSGSDGAVFVVERVDSAFFHTAYIRARGAGTAVLRATSEGQTGEASITVRSP
jgi:uncharacterized protein YjdB